MVAETFVLKYFWPTLATQASISIIMYYLQSTTSCLRRGALAGGAGAPLEHELAHILLHNGHNHWLTISSWLLLKPGTVWDSAGTSRLLKYGTKHPSRALKH